MPQVPRYTPQEQLKPLPTPRVDEDAFGAGVGRAMEQAGNRMMATGDMLGQNALKLYEQVDRTAAKEAYAKMLEQMRGTLHGENGLFSRKGKNAVNLYRDGDDALNELYDTIAGELKSERQKRYFHDMAFNKLETARDQIARHEAEQIRVYEAEAADALIQQSQGDAIANYTDAVAFSNAISEGLEQIDEFGATMGLPEEALALKKEDYLSGVHVEVINQMLANDDGKGARAWYEGHKKEIKGTVRDEIEKAIKSVELTVWAQENTDDIMRKFSSESKAIEWIRKKYSGDKEDKLVSYVKTRFTEKEAAEREWKVGLFDSHAKKLEGMSASERLAYVDKLNVPASVKDSLYTYINKLDRTLKLNTDDPQYNANYFAAREAVEGSQYKSYREFEMDFIGKLTPSHMRDIWKLNPDNPKSGMFGRVKTNVQNLLKDTFEDRSDFVEPYFNAALNDLIEEDDSETEILEKAKNLLKIYQVNHTWGPDPDAYGFQLYNIGDQVRVSYPDAQYDLTNGYWFVIRGGKKMRIKIEDAPDESDIPKDVKEWTKD